jgi:hypothetical protein
MLLNCGDGGRYDRVVEVGSRSVDAAFGPVVALVSALVGEGCRRYPATL